MIRILAAALIAAALTAGGGLGAVQAHALLDHASPAVGSSVSAAPAAVTLWFTEDIEPGFSTLTVRDPDGHRVDLGNQRVPPGQPAVLQIGLKPLTPGTYTVTWRVVSVDTHPTQGSFTFRVGGG